MVGYASDTASAVAKVEPNSNRSRETGRPYYRTLRAAPVVIGHVVWDIIEDNSTFQPWIDLYVPSCGTIKLNALRPGQNGHHIADYIFKRISFSWLKTITHHILIKMSLNIVQYGLINNNPAFGSGNGSSPNKRQSVTPINNYPVQWRTYASSGLMN